MMLEISNLLKKYSTPKQYMLINPSLYQIKGNVFEQSKIIKASCKVFLFERHSMQLEQITTCNTNGEYQFINLPKKKYCVAAQHPLKKFNITIQDNVVPK